MSVMTPLLSIDLGRGTRRFQRFVTLRGSKPSAQPPRPRGVMDPDLLRSALPNAVRKLDPRLLIRNPVMFVVELTAVLVTMIAVANATGWQPTSGPGGLGFQVQIAVWLGSPSCSRPMPRRSLRPEAGPRPPPCGARAR
jgi:hypothetical protein